MRPDRRSIDIAARVDPNDILRHAQGRGWILTRSVPGAFHVLSHPESDLDQVLVPRSTLADDFAQRVVEAADRLAEREGRTAHSILSDLLCPPSDILRFRVSGVDVDQWDISYSHLANVIAGIEKCLRAAACSIVKPQTFHPRLSRSEADQLMQSCRLRQTEPGSFTIVVACPLASVDRPLSVDSTVPFVRLVTCDFMQSLQWIQGVGSNSEDSSPERMPLVVSANLCEGLLDMQPEDERAFVAIEPSWDSSIALPESMKPDMKAELRREHFTLLNDLSRSLRPRDDEAHPIALVGRVDRLNGTPDEDGRVCGEIVLSLMMEDTILRARADLTPDDYVRAIEAHRWNRLVRLSGVVRRGRKLHRVDRVNGFALVDSIFS